MTPELTTYIETIILPDAGIVEDETAPLLTVDGFTHWIEHNLHIDMPVTIGNLQDYLCLDSEGIIQKRRSFYINTADFYLLDLPSVHAESVLLHKEIMTVLVFPSDIVARDTFYFVTDDEWMIMQQV